MGRSEEFDLGGVSFHHDVLNVLPWQQPQHFVSARIGGQEVGHVRWASEGEQAGRVVHVQVHPSYQRRGIATAMFRHAQGIDPRVRHSEDQTDEGKAWAAAEQRRR